METLQTLIQAVYRQDVALYKQLVAPDVSSFESDVAPYRIDTLDFHLNLLTHQGSRRAQGDVRVDILTPRIQIYGDCAIATYTLLVTRASSNGIGFAATNETRVFIRRGDQWIMVHLHRSPAASSSGSH